MEIFNYKGYSYQPCDEFDGDVNKIFHDVVTPGDALVSIDFSPYCKLTLDDFKKWIDLGMPDRGDMRGPLRSEDLNKLWESKSLRFIKE